MKLVRDKIKDRHPDLTYINVKDTPTSFEAFTRLKLAEEMGEVLSSHTRKDLVSELGDLIDVAEALASTQGITREEIDNARKAKTDLLGGFSKGWILING